MFFLFEHKRLIGQLVKRDILTRYKNLSLGLLWIILTPLMMLSVYALVFSSILKSRWPGSSESEFEFAIILFCGLIVFNLFVDIVSKAPTLILANVNYVKKVVFPIEILPIVVLGGALFQTLINIVILLIFYFAWSGNIHWTTILFPLILAPFMLLLMGFGWFLSALGVFIRDIGQVIAIIITGLMFLSPLFFPLNILPEAIQPYLYLNPVSFIIEQMRDVIIWGRLPDWSGLLIYTASSLFLTSLGFVFFKKTRAGFADVL